MSNLISDFIDKVWRDDRSRYTLAATGTALTLLSMWAINDQHRWKSHDTGGTPPTWYGYLRMTTIRVLRLLKGGSLTDHYFLRHNGEKYLRESIEPRQWPRPKKREWVLPQRLETVPIDPEVHARIFSWTEKYVEANPEILEYRLSKAEGHSSPAVYAKAGLATQNPKADNKILGLEIFHAHPEDGSLHVWMSESDLKEVVSRGWGEQFPLRDFGLTPPGFGFVYTPRTMAECDVVEEIIRAGIHFVTGQRPEWPSG